MVRLFSKVTGMDVWAYDVSRRPDKTLSNGRPKLDHYCEVNKQSDSINPVTHEPTEYLNENINQFRIVFDINHCSNGTELNTHGMKWSINNPINSSIKTNDYSSVAKYNNVIFDGDEIYVEPQSNKNPTRSTRNTPFTTKTTGIKILYQSGIVQYRRGYSAILFEVEKGYKIPKGAIVKATPQVQNDFSGMLQDGTPETYNVVYDIVPGIYEITLTADQYSDWDSCEIDFQTKQDASTLPHSTVTFELSHCTVEPSDTTVVNGLHSWTFTAENGYVFDHTGGVMNINTGMTGDEIPKT